ncbi:sulfate ABC transporter, periplasmic sulfate-binding protein [Gluconacetobacter diazotrophicus PA1 5]|uniref:Sulfate ABC transporter substrate-binding protein n=2 Tax=Gluconacetobacter diazotrophicus TaxID=33996 RepID=A0A7W4FC71_GLUDI|nr:sulfate ABC transporter substrate-binding protein [Gluconacetobacter diazotrophicus]ACI51229.1 sulfate ABC transporter, periplasmic sulfate-binding protein [Gluconacetobacter diazotrophicus PA1 5]MBB2155066.1 sulfate ABC transporter substrate-binding protein [Gluconacetobacter diazotrophicus]TWB09777.1 sulfate transport system substrate-binding protein [Gluconacetobacter diazotrophicus]CAP54501.1 putative sulfate-binding protein precursor [Gluconacetobacter diazotrophicus PA1 5]
MTNVFPSSSRRAFLAGAAAGAASLAVGPCPARAATPRLLNVSYDPTRELYADVSRAFAASWAGAHGGERVVVTSSHGGSGAQARSVLEGAPADVVTLGLAYDIDILAQNGLLAADWQQRLPHNSTPYTSTIVFLVRKGNPKGIHDWPDLIRDGVQVITPNPKTSGGARWNYLAAWGWALRQPGGSEASARAYLKALFGHVPVLDTGARGATNSFVQRGLGDVLIAWEDEALLASRDLGPDKFDIVVPPLTILAEPPVAVVDRNVQAHGTAAVAEAYLRFLFTPEGQRIGVKHYFRPVDPAIIAESASVFPKTTVFDVASLGGWTRVQKTHFADGGVFDQIYSR